MLSKSLLLSTLAVESVLSSAQHESRQSHRHFKRDLLASVIYLQQVVTFEICLLSDSARQAVNIIQGISSSNTDACVQPINPNLASTSITSTTSTAITSTSALRTTSTSSSSSTSTSSTSSTSSSIASGSVSYNSTIYSNSTSNSTSTSSSSVPVSTSPFTLSQSYSGSSFLDGWDFFTDADPTHGQVTFLNEVNAKNAGLVYTTSSGALVMRTDNYTTLPSGANRNSIRITSKQPVTIGSLVLMDASKMPFGPTIWPAFWTVGANWPYGGEIDIVEGVHNAVKNQYTLHSSSGCYLKTPMNGTGTVTGTNCDSSGNSNNGCGVVDKSTSSYGSGWNAAGGGVYAMYWTTAGIQMWEFNRANIPSDITSGAPNFQNWPLSSASFDSSSCNMNQYFGPQTLVFDITLCGDWSGNQAVWNAAGFNGTCSQAVADPKNYDNAVFEVNYVKVFTLH